MTNKSTIHHGLRPRSEVFLHSVAYCGLARAINATKVAKQIFAEPQLG